ncbi:DUF5677 domain-containing protein [Collimonas fungivorans]|uniref:DUF5677 domain-containing protein n=1 Tax=Collimonas fungivorans TaxID=158899 RepID=UPI0007786FEA|nr:DUF5677 domain-containing protein [Collimonas fungivorans]
MLEDRARQPEAVYLPHNEPYLGRVALLQLDLEIPRALQKNLAIAKHTFEINKSPLQTAACELIPQAISIALSIRELLRQGYVFSAVILLRSMLERLALIIYLCDTPSAVDSWHAGWERKTQPSFKVLMQHLDKANKYTFTEVERQKFSDRLHKVVHPDPAAAIWNTTERGGRPAFASGKLINAPETCDFCAAFTHQCLSQLIRVALVIFPEANRSDSMQLGEW